MTFWRIWNRPFRKYKLESAANAASPLLRTKGFIAYPNEEARIRCYAASPLLRNYDSRFSLGPPIARKKFASELALFPLIVGLLCDKKRSTQDVRGHLRCGLFLSRTILGETVYIFIRGIKERVTIQSVVDRGSNNFCNVVSVSCLQVESYHGIIIFATGNICMSKNTMLLRY